MKTGRAYVYEWISYCPYCGGVTFKSEDYEDGKVCCWKCIKYYKIKKVL